MSRTNIEISDELVKEGLKVTNFKTKRQLVNYALQELVRREKRRKIMKFMGSKCWAGNLDKMREL